MVQVVGKKRREMVVLLRGSQAGLLGLLCGCVRE